MEKTLADLFDAELLNDLEVQVGTADPNFNEKVADLLIGEMIFFEDNFTNLDVSRDELIKLVEDYYGY